MAKLGSIALGTGQVGTTGRDVVDIITFVEASWGLDTQLFPVQRVILKAYYGIELDDNAYGFPLDVPVDPAHPAYDPELLDIDGYYKHRVVITDFRRENLKVMTEAGYLEYLHSEKRCNIGKVTVGHERREMVLAIGRRSGKCVLGDTLVLTDKGVLRIDTLGDPNGAEYQPLDVTVAQEGAGHQSQSAFFYNGGVKPVRTLSTHCGYTVGGTDSHRIKVLGLDGHVQWRYLSDVQEGDVVAIHRRTNLWVQEQVDLRSYHNEVGYKAFNLPSTLDERWGLMLGLLAGDGGWTNRSHVYLTVADPETWVIAKSLFDELFGNHFVSMDLRSENNLGAVGCSGQSLRKFLHDLGWSWDCDSYNKMVPWAIMQSPEPVVRAFLRGLFETDGGGESEGHVVSFCSASKRLAHEVQTLLLNLGIVSRVRAKWNEEYQRHYYILTVRGLHSRQVFMDKVGFLTSRKRDPLLKVLGVSKREGGDTESIPHLRGLVCKLLQSVPRSKAGQGWARSTLRVACGNTIKPCSTEDVTYSRLAKILPVARALGADPEIIQHLQSICDLGYFYDVVENITESEAPVYDLTVPDGQMFVANGFTNHNTMLSACIAAYETYRLILKGDPQTYYGLPGANNIQLISVATDKDQAGLLYQEVSGHFRKCGFFAKYTANNTQSYARFQSPKDIERYGMYAQDASAKATIKVTFRSCVAKGLRGAGNIVVVLDEMAHFTDNGQSSADNVYKAVTPSTATFSPKDPRDKRKPIGPVESKVIAISSPLGKQGPFYQLFGDGYKGGKVGDNRLCVQAATWEVNPTVPADFLEAEYIKDPRSFFTEFGADFTDRTRGWLDGSKDLLACVDPTLRPRTKAMPRMPHFLGFDLGLVTDPSAVAIGHIDERNRIVLDLADYIKAGEGEYIGQERLDFGEVADWVHDYTRRFFIEEGIFDQWAGIPFEQALQERGLKQFQSVHHTAQLTSQMYQNFLDMMYDKRLALYDWPIDGNKHCEYIEQIIELQAEYKSRYVTIVSAPNTAGKHDDLADAIVRMVWIASKHVGNTSVIAGAQQRRSPVLSQIAQRSALKSLMQAKRKAKLSGSSPERQIQRKLGFGSGGRGGGRGGGFGTSGFGSFGRR